jgi:hypothetical protein
MDREEIIRMAREAGLRVGTNLSGVVLVGSPAEIGLAHLTIEELERFAALVAAAEREACAKVCDQMFHDWCNQEFEDEDEAYRNKPDAEDCKKAIRARGNT